MLFSCPFCEISEHGLVHTGRLVIAIWDRYPVSPGHALIIPRRHCETWFDATPEEQTELLTAVDVVRQIILQRHKPDGFNLGINVGETAGQTVPHLHLHVIPRYKGDVEDPAGGVRHVIPSKANYLRSPQGAPDFPSLPHSRALVYGGNDPLLPHLRAQLDHADAVDIAVAFTLESGLRDIFEHLRDLLIRGGRLRSLTGDYLDVTEPAALSRLLDLEGNVQLRVFETGGKTSFHPKAYIFHQRDLGSAYVGSSNLSSGAMRDGIEWNLRFVSTKHPRDFEEVVEAYETLFNHRCVRQLDQHWIDEYSARRRQPNIQVLREAGGTFEPSPPPEPHEVQQEALAALKGTRQEGNSTGLVVLATGLGKTWLSAFDSFRPEYRRVLFVAHRDEILGQAMATYRRIRPTATLGRCTGNEKAPDADVLFASIQTLGRNYHLEQFSREAFDYIVVDEFHHAAAKTYRNLLDYFSPKFLLGLTATPERTDGGDLLALCQENLVYRCDITDGIRRGLLSPFHYFGVPDSVDYTNIPWRSSRFDEEALTNAVATRVRADNVLQQYREHGGLRTLAFCCSQRHADFMSSFFCENGLRAVSVHSGTSSAPRAASLEQLEAGEIDIVCSVDMFNEGVDRPRVDTVMMLRPTESRILFLQQFGRGLRVSPEKQKLTVIDYIGNHRSFLIKPRALLGLGETEVELAAALDKIRTGKIDLPPGCEVTYDLETINMLRELLRLRAGDDLVKAYYTDFRERYGQRPTATEAFHDGYNPRSLRPTYGSWLRFVRMMGDFTPVQEAAFSSTHEFLDSLETTPMTKSFKMLTLLALLNEDALPGEMSIDDLVRAFLAWHHVLPSGGMKLVWSWMTRTASRRYLSRTLSRLGSVAGELAGSLISRMQKECSVPRFG